MGQPASKIEAAYSDEPSLVIPPNSDHRITASRIRTLPPPPPLAALTKRAPDDEPRAISMAPVSRPSPLPEAPPLPLEERFELDLAPNPRFAAALSQPPRRRSMPWLRIAAAAISALALLSVGYLAATLRMQAPQPGRPGVVPAGAASAAISPQLAVLSANAASPSASPANAALAESPSSAPSSNATEVSSAAAQQPQAATRTEAPHAAAAAQATHAAAINTGRSNARVAVPSPTNVPEPRATDSAQPVPSASGDEPIAPSALTQPAAPVELADNPKSALPEARDALAPIDDLPAQPTREQVQQGLQQIQPALVACAAGAHGVSVANVTLASSGRVSHGTIEGVFAGTPQGSCMARALRTASFPAFSAQNFSVKYPFRL
jgi:hypothetical protein